MFPVTRHSVLASAASGDAEARRDGFGLLVQAYWKPVYKYVRLRWRAAPEEAEDLTQAFFARAFEKRQFDSFDASRARFRTFLRTCLDGFVANQRQAGHRLKRGGAAVIHRDLKPENVMLGSFGEVLVLDWGIARAHDPEAEGIVIGTPGVMAPEQAGGAGAVDPRADVFGLGGLLASLCGGAAMPRPLAAIAAKAVAADPAARYATAGELAADVTAFAHGLPVTAYRENLLEQTVRLGRRNRSAILLGMVYLLLRMSLLIAERF